MNKIQKDKGMLCGLGITSIVFAIGLLAVGIILLLNGIPAIAEGKGIAQVIIGAICLLMFIPAIGFGIYGTWLGFSLKATQGSIKEGNIAKEGGTVNMKKCDRCGTEIKDGETVCSECQKPVE